MLKEVCIPILEPHPSEPHRSTRTEIIEIQSVGKKKTCREDKTSMRSSLCWLTREVDGPEGSCAALCSPAGKEKGEGGFDVAFSSRKGRHMPTGDII